MNPEKSILRYVTITILKIKEKNLKSSQRERIHYLHRNINSNDSGIFVCNHGGQNKVVSCVNGKEPSTEDSMSRETVFQKCRENKNILRQRKTKNLTLAKLPVKIS